MKKLIFILCLGLVAPLVGCALLKQSNAAHHAIEAQHYDVDQVVVKVENGRKTAVVYTKMKLTPEDKQKIEAIVKEKIPDAKEVIVSSPASVGAAKPTIKGKPPVNPPIKGKPPAKANPPIKGKPPAN